MINSREQQLSRW